MPDSFRSRRQLRRLHVYAGVVCVTGLALSYLAAHIQAHANDALVQAQFEGAAREVVDRLVTRVSSYEYGLRGARGAILSVGEDEVSRRSFARYSASRDLEREFPGARGFGFIRRVPVDREAAFIATARRDGMPDFAVRTLMPHAGDRYVIQYIEPLDRNREAVGLDIASEATRRTAARASMLSGTATLSAPLTLVQATEHPARALLLMLPIYRPDVRLDTPEARERATFGWTYAPLVIDEILKSFASESLTLSLYDVSAGSAPQRFFSSTAETSSPATGPLARLSRPILGRTWEFEVQARQRFIASLNLVSARRVFVVGVLGAILIGGLFYTYLLSRQHTRLAHEQRSRLALIVENSRDAIIGLTLDARVSSWSRAAEQIFGYSSEAALGRPLDELVGTDAHPDTVASVVARIKRAEIIAPFDAEQRRSDGARVDVSISASPVTRRAQRIIGVGLTIRDISDRKAVERQRASFQASLERQVAERTLLLEDARRHLERILDALPSLVGYWNKDLIHGFGNRAYSSWFGLDAGQLPGKHIREVLGGRTFELNRNHIEAALRGEPQTFEQTLPRPNGAGVLPARRRR